ASAFSSLGLSELQETRIQNIVQAKAFDLAEIYDFSGETQDALNDIAQQLASILNPTAEPDDQKVCIYAVETEARRPAIELF
ncbi:MAG: hypothetical protein JZU63_05510, partial [Rhodoferax sp.]|nr:hypothetical protein [Rhodoferax sp.]